MNTRLCCLPLCILAFFGGGCAGVAMTAASVGGGVAVSHQLGGLAYRTFTGSLPEVREAVMAALQHMAIPMDSSEKTELGERILAQAADRNIEIEIEALTPNATRLRVVVRKKGGVIVDSATAVEIVNQTERFFAPSQSEDLARQLLSQ